VQISNTCTVFAESEVIGLMARKQSREDIIAGLHQSIASRVYALANRLRVADDVAFTGGVALNEMMATPRTSRDIDLFHDTDEALEASWAADRHLLEDRGFTVVVIRERPSFVEAEVGKGGQSVLMEWARDSAFRFFPLVRHPDLGLTLHPFDLATNKVLALVGRLEVRDWVDLIHASERIQPLGSRSARYSADEVANPRLRGATARCRGSLSTLACDALYRPTDH
jgi:hypothetical protein